MAQVKLHSIIDSIHGKMDPKARVIMRQKKYRAPNGAVLCEGVQESYTMDHPRDFEKTPAKGAEKANMRAFGDISLQASAIIRAGRLTEEELAAMPSEERAQMEDLRAQLEDFQRRFYAQFKNADPEAPFEKKLAPGASVLRRRQYVKLDNFIQAILRQRKS